MIILKRVDPARGLDRWYGIAVTVNLFGDVVLWRGWGSRRTAFQRVRGDVVASVQMAEQAQQRLLERKLKRGYTIVSQT